MFWALTFPFLFFPFPFYWKLLKSNHFIEYIVVLNGTSGGMTSVNFNKITGADHGGITDMCKCAGWLIQMTVATMLLRLALVPQKWITN